MSYLYRNSAWYLNRVRTNIGEWREPSQNSQLSFDLQNQLNNTADTSMTQTYFANLQLDQIRSEMRAQYIREFHGKEKIPLETIDRVQKTLRTKKETFKGQFKDCLESYGELQGAFDRYFSHQEQMLKELQENGGVILNHLQLQQGNFRPPNITHHRMENPRQENQRLKEEYFHLQLKCQQYQRLIVGLKNTNQYLTIENGRLTIDLDKVKINYKQLEKKLHVERVQNIRLDQALKNEEGLNQGFLEKVHSLEIKNAQLILQLKRAKQMSVKLKEEAAHNHLWAQINRTKTNKLFQEIQKLPQVNASLIQVAQELKYSLTEIKDQTYG